jgi:branched-chain amino acid transport system ATP-binding protein
MLEISGVSVQFGGVRALDDVGLVAKPGQVTGLIGPNGAGKSTMFNAVTGLVRPVGPHKIVVNGRDITKLGPRDRARAGVGRTFQRLELFGALTARENVLVALEGRSLRRGNATQAADALLERMGLTAVANTTADLLSTGTARLLEMARAIACAPAVLLLDEPSSGLNNTESARLGTILLELAAEGMTILLVEHDMDLIMAVCSHIYVLDFGHLIASGTPAEIQASPEVRRAYLGIERDVVPA